jgi:hypothetical protein
MMTVTDGYFFKIMYREGYELHFYLNGLLKGSCLTLAVLGVSRKGLKELDKRFLYFICNMQKQGNGRGEK